MNPFLHGFIDELVKLGAGGQMVMENAPPTSGIVSAMQQGMTLGKSNKPSPAAPRSAAPMPLTTPSIMTSYAGG